MFAVGAHSVTRAFKSHDVVHKVPEKLIPLSSLDLGLYSYFANASINIRKNDSKDGIKHSCYKNRSCCCCCDNLVLFLKGLYTIGMTFKIMAIKFTWQEVKCILRIVSLRSTVIMERETLSIHV